MVPESISESRLGYRGFIVRVTGEDAVRFDKGGQALEFRVRDGLDTTATYGPDAEGFLSSSLRAGPLLVETDVAELAEITQGDAGVTAAACSLLYTSSNNFSFWNGARRRTNNCYNYAANFASNTFAQPGRRGGKRFTALTVPAIKAAMRRDGWVSACSGGNLRVALVIWPGWDYHFYRRNLNANLKSRWCHKPGRTRARNRDNSGKVIVNPRGCDRGNYTVWGGGHMFSDGVRSRNVR